jgi:hypothetical protein
MKPSVRALSEWAPELHPILGGAFLGVVGFELRLEAPAGGRPRVLDRAGDGALAALGAARLLAGWAREETLAPPFISVGISLAGLDTQRFFRDIEATFRDAGTTLDRLRLSVAIEQIAAAPSSFPGFLADCRSRSIRIEYACHAGCVEHAWLIDAFKPDVVRVPMAVLSALYRDDAVLAEAVHAPLREAGVKLLVCGVADSDEADEAVFLGADELVKAHSGSRVGTTPAGFAGMMAQLGYRDDR